MSIQEYKEQAISLSYQYGLVVLVIDLLAYRLVLFTNPHSEYLEDNPRYAVVETYRQGSLIE